MVELRPLGQMPNGQYVLAKYTGGNWIDGEDDDGCLWVVVKRGHHGRFTSFGPSSFTSRDLAGWLPLPGR